MEKDRLELSQMLINQIEEYLLDQFRIEILDRNDNELTFRAFKENFKLQISELPIAKIEKQ